MLRVLDKQALTDELHGLRLERSASIRRQWCGICVA